MKRDVVVALPLVAFCSLTMCGNSSSSSPGADGGTGEDATSGGSSGGTSGSGSGSASGSGSGSGGGSGSSSGASGGSSGGSGSSSGAGAEAGVDAGASVGASVLMYHDHVDRDGFFVDPLITAAKAKTFARDTTFDGSLPASTDMAWTSPLYVENGVGGKGTFYVATAGDNLYALDETTGKNDWAKPANFGTPATQSGIGCGNVSPLGITGTPAIDLATRLIVFDAVSADTNGNIKTHTIYGASIDDGSTKWSVDVSTLTDGNGTTFSPQLQNQRPAVLIVGGVAYVAFGGHIGDCESYHGWVVGVPLTGQGAKAWATSGTGAGIWGVGGPASDGQSIFVATGNDNAAILGQNQPMTPWPRSEGVLRFDPGPSFTGQTADYFAPNNWYSMDQGDVDIDGSGLLVVDAPALTTSKLVVAQGKDGYIYLSDRTNLGGVASAPYTANVGALQVSQGEISNGGAFATVGGTTYIVVRPNGGGNGQGCPNGTSGELVAVKIDPAAASKMSVAWCANAMGSGSPIITTSDGTNDALVWVAGGEPGSDPADTNQLHAFDLLTGQVVFAGGAAADKFTSTVRHFGTVAAVHGRIFALGDGQLYAFSSQ